MSFSVEVKQEILSQEFNKEQALALIHGVINSSGEEIGNTYAIKLNNNEISSEVRIILKELKIKNSLDKQNKNWIIIKKEEISLEDKIKQPGYYFAGVFVGGGSISDPNTSSYHLEVQFYYQKNANKVMKYLDKYKFNFQLIQRRKKWVIYLKKSDLISDFLKAVQATNSLIKFEDVRIQRDYLNHLNRYSNLDLHNQEKLSKASAYHLQNYEYVLDNKMENFFKPDELKFFELKKQNPYSSLAELVVLLREKGIEKTRAGLNHWLIKLRKIAEK